MPETTYIGCCCCIDTLDPCVDVCDCFAQYHFDSCKCMSKDWILTASGFTDLNGTCLECASFNGTHSLRHSSGCLWETSTTGPCNAGNKRWKLNYSASLNRWEATNAAGTLYVKALADWVCNGTNSMSLQSNGDCGTVPTPPPSSISVSPVGTCPEAFCFECGGCTVFPKKWKLTVSGVTNGTCSNCTSFNGEFELVRTHPVPGFPSPFYCVRWAGGAGINCGGPAPAPWELYTGFSNAGWFLDAVVGTGVPANTTIAEYGLADADWNCLGLNEMPLLGSPSTPHCSWPSTVLLEPIL